MDKNVSSVDLDELRKAREELNREIGVETDPNMYNDYNPNRESSTEELISENSDNVSSENTDDNLDDAKKTDSSEEKDHIVLENSRSDNFQKENTFTDGYSEESKKEEPKEENHSTANQNLDKYDIFSAFEIKENVHESAGDKLDFDKLEDSSQRTTNLEKIETELMKSASEDADESDSTDLADSNSKFDTIDNVEELEVLLDKLLEELDEEDELPSKDSENKTDISDETKDETQIEIKSDDEDLTNSYLTSLDVEPKFDDALPKINEMAVNQETEPEQVEDDLDEQDLSPKEDRLEKFMKGSLGSSNSSKEIETAEDSEDTQNLSNVETENSVQIEESVDEIEDINSAQELENVDVEEQNLEEKQDDTNLETKTESDNIEIEEDDFFEVKEDNKSEETDNKKVSVTLESYDATKASPSAIKRTNFENSLSDEGTEVITDYSQLREILQRELKESELASQEKIEEDEGEKYELIEEFKFIDEVASEEFKNSDKFSYIMGKNEKGEMVYGNFREHFNLAVFGKNETVTNSFLNAMVLSLCLKNSTADVNFVMLDSNINSTFEVYNKSSYMYFNRIAKTNKEILDTLIEITKELDVRYDKLAEAGMNNIEQFNDMAKETATTPMPHLIVVFNNYTSASQATYIDKINTCLYQILKFGRIVGIYAVVTAMLPIETNQVNYNLSSRLSFKSDQDSKYTVGVEGSHRLPDENDAIYFNISKNTTEHIKSATVTETELDLIIKELEEED